MYDAKHPMYASVQELLNNFCHIYPKAKDADGNLIVDYETPFACRGQATLRTATYKLPESYDGVGKLTPPDILFRGQVWVLHHNPDGTIFCTYRPAYGEHELMKAYAGENAIVVPGMDNVPITVDDDGARVAEYEFDPDCVIGILDGGSVAMRNGDLLIPGFPQRTTIHRYDAFVPPYDPAHADSVFLPGYPYDVQVRKNWKYVRMSDLPHGTYSQARCHKGVAELIGGKKIIKAAFANIGDLDGAYPFSDNHAIVRDTSAAGDAVTVDIYGENGKSIRVSNKAGLVDGSLYTYTVDKSGVYTLTADTTKQGEGREVLAVVSQDRFYLQREGSKDFIATRCAVVTEEQGKLEFRRVGAIHATDPRHHIYVWGKENGDGAFEFLYVYNDVDYEHPKSYK